MQATETETKTRRELHLLHPLNGERSFAVGDNCDAIERSDGGYDVHRGSALIHVADHRVDHFVQDPRPGFAQEQRDVAAGELPSYAEKLDDGTFKCRGCGVEKRTLHALRVHYGRTHGGERG